MKHAFIVHFCFVFLSFPFFSQNEWVWAKDVSPFGFDPVGVKVTDAGNVFIATNNSRISKFTASGQLIWSTQLSGLNNRFVEMYADSIDNLNVLIYTNEAYNEPFSDTTVNVDRYCLLNFDINGRRRTVHNIKKFTAINCDHSGNIYYLHSDSLGRKITKVTNLGAKEWEVAYSSDAQDFALNQLTTTKNSIIINGTFKDSVTIDTMKYVANGNAITSYLAAFSYDGKLKDFQTISGALISEITSDASENIFISGFFDSMMVVAQNTLVIENWCQSYCTNEFIGKFSKLNSCQWLKQIKVNRTHFTIKSMQVTASGDCYYTLMNPGPFKVDTILIDHPASSLLVFKFDPQGNIEWIKGNRVVNSGSAYPENISVSKGGLVLIGGTYKVSGIFSDDQCWFGDFYMPVTLYDYRFFVAALADKNLVGLTGNQENRMKIYPNPAADKLYIDGMDLEKGCIRIFDLSGKEVLTKKFENSTSMAIDIQILESGFYTILLESFNNRATAKLIVNNTP